MKLMGVCTAIALLALTAGGAAAQTGPLQSKHCKNRGLTPNSTEALACEIVRLKRSVEKQSKIVIQIPIRGEVDDVGRLTANAKATFEGYCATTGYASALLIESRHFPTIPHALICYD